MNDILNTLGPIMVFVALAAISVLLIVFWVSMIVSAIKNPRLSSGSKVMWVLAIVILELLGAIVYYFAAHKPVPAKTSKE